MFIHWQEAFETGQAMIDAEHRMLLFLFRKMDVAIKTRVPPETLHDIVSEVVRFVRFHFTSEENLMKESAYPGLDLHVVQHQDLLVKLDSVTHKVAKGNEFPEDMLYFLSEWLSEHIAKHDQDIARHLRQASERPIAEFAYAEYLAGTGRGTDGA